MSNIDLRLGDCLEILPTITSRTIDAIIIDPPFFMPATHYQSRVSWGRSWGDLSILGQYFFNLCDEFKRLLTEDGHLFVFCHDESYPVFYPGCFGLWDFTAGLIWDKTRIGLGKVFRHQFEMILWASNKGAFVNNDGKTHSNILSYAPTLTKDRTHPVEKPVRLMVELIEVSTRDNGVVLDCFMGSGATGLACIQTDRDFIGIEIDAKYFEIAERRMRETKQQLPLPISIGDNGIQAKQMAMGIEVED